MKRRYTVDGIVVDHEVFTTKFVCDIERCKGICCYYPDETFVGPPLTNEEMRVIRRLKDDIADCIPQDGWKNPTRRQSLARTKLFMFDGHKPPYRVRLYDCSCIYCTANGCLLKDLHAKLPEVDEPISCLLYPLAEETVGSQVNLSVEHYFDEDCCYSAYEKGERENTYLIDFLKAPLVRRFGEDFYKHLKEKQVYVIKHQH